MLLMAPSQVRRMYKFVVKRRLLGSSQVPDLEYLKVQDDGNINETFLPETSINNFGVGCRTNVV